MLCVCVHIAFSGDFRHSSAAAASVRGGGAAACEGWSRSRRSLSENYFAFGKSSSSEVEV